MNCFYTLLEQESLLHIAGPDTLKFLQGQTTCDTRNVTPQHAAPGAFCTPQGRVVCDFLLCELAPDHFALRMRRDIRASSAAAFGKYIIFSKATIDATAEDWVAIAIWGTDAASALKEVFGEAPTEQFSACGDTDFALVQMDAAGEQFECFVQQEHSSARLAQLDAVMERRPEAQWQALQITGGIARIESTTTGEYVPQVLNYDLTGHISFKKGCYTGQEVVARLHYRGKSKRRAYAAEAPEEAYCAAGVAVFDATSGASAGTVINGSSTQGKTWVLIAATADSVANGLRLGAADGPALSPLQLPYAIPQD